MIIAAFTKLSNSKMAVVLNWRVTSTILFVVGFLAAGQGEPPGNEDFVVRCEYQGTATGEPCNTITRVNSTGVLA